MKLVMSLTFLLILSFDTQCMEEKIKIKVGGKSFSNIERSVLVKHHSIFQVMFENKSKFTAAKDEHGYYIVDGNPYLFESVLDFMKYDIITLKRTSHKEIQAERLLLLKEADRYSLRAMVEALAWDFFHETKELDKVPTEVWLQLPVLPLRIVKLESVNNEPNYFSVCDHPMSETPIIIGNSEFGCTTKKECQKKIENRKNNLVIAWTGKIDLPHNIVTNKFIGEKPNQEDFDFDATPLITHILRGRYICSRAYDYGFAIFDVVSAKKIKQRKNITYENLDDCITDLHALFSPDH